MGRERAAARKLARDKEVYDAKKKPLLPLSVGDYVAVQNGTGSHPLRWDRTARVVERLEHRKYMVKMDGSGRVLARNRRHLKKIGSPDRDLSVYDVDVPVSGDVGGIGPVPLLIPGGLPGAQVIHPVEDVQAW